MNNFLDLSVRRFVAVLIVLFLFILIVDAATLQLQMYLFDGYVLTGNVIFKFAILVIAVLGSLIYMRRLKFKGLPILIWLLCLGYLLADVPHLISAHAMTLVDVLQSYNAYYALLLIGPMLLAFRGAVSERVAISCIVIVLSVCAILGMAQYLTGNPILFTESVDGAFKINSWSFFDQVRAFALFSSPMNFGLFCAFCGALGVALWKRARVKGIFLFVLSALACYCTLTRLSYLVFFCACSYALLLTFGKKPRRGLWQPVLYFLLGVSTIVVGLLSFTAAESNLGDTGSLIQRVSQWGLYSGWILQANATDKAFGLGIVQNEKLSADLPAPIDSAPLALVLHIGFLGLALFGVLLTQMWLYLRRQALETGQPLVIAAASFWATFGCAGIFNIVFSTFGAVFALAILCSTDGRIEPLQKKRGNVGTAKLKPLRLELARALNDA
ncbi:MAG: hypothetical protein WCC95_14285 [Candidatus Sulfotelmatobacter sp.]